MFRNPSLAVAAIALSSFSASLYADTILGVYVGASTWNSELDGDLGSETNNVSLEELGHGSENNLSLWVALEHPIPLIPNVKLTSTNIESSGSGTITQAFTLGDETYSANTPLTSSVDLSHIDGTLYYEILDNWVTLDVGLTARMFDGDASAQEGTNPASTSEFSGTLPLGYLHAKFELPFTGWSVSGTANAISYDGDSVTDISAAVGYSSGSLLVVDLGLNVGYRQFSIKADELDDLFVDVDLSGPFVEFIVHF